MAPGAPSGCRVGVLRRLALLPRSMSREIFGPPARCVRSWRAFSAAGLFAAEISAGLCPRHDGGARSDPRSWYGHGLVSSPGCACGRASCGTPPIATHLSATVAWCVVVSSNAPGPTLPITPAAFFKLVFASGAVCHSSSSELARFPS